MSFFILTTSPDTVHERRPGTWSTCCGLVTHWLGEDRQPRPVPGVREATAEERVTLTPCRGCERWQARRRDLRVEQVVDVDERGRITRREVQS